MNVEDLLEDFVKKDKGWEGWGEDNQTNGKRQFYVGRVEGEGDDALEDDRCADKVDYDDQDSIIRLFRRIYKDGRFICSICIDPLYELEFPEELQDDEIGSKVSLFA